MYAPLPLKLAYGGLWPGMDMRQAFGFQVFSFQVTTVRQHGKPAWFVSRCTR